MRKLILVSLIVVGCGQAQNVDAFTASTPELYVIAMDFKAYKDKLQPAFGMNNVSISFSTVMPPGLNKNTIAACQFQSNIIVIDINYWAKIDDLSRKLVLFHELGHCVLHRIEHNDALVTRSGHVMPASIMNSIPDEVRPYIEENLDYYINELFMVEGK